MPEPEWYQIHDNLILLTSYLVERGDSASDVAYAVAKPWKYEDDFQEAQFAVTIDSMPFADDLRD